MMRITKNCWIVTAALLLVLWFSVWVIWETVDGPPLGYVLRYGHPHGGERTGRVWQHPSGLQFIEIREGYRWCSPGRLWSYAPNLVEQGLSQLGLRRLTQIEEKGLAQSPKWVEIPHSIWVSETVVTQDIIEKLQRLTGHPLSAGARSPDDMWRCIGEIINEFVVLAPDAYRIPTQDEWRCAVEARSVELAPALSESLTRSSGSGVQNVRRAVAGRTESRSAAKTDHHSFRLVLDGQPCGYRPESE